MPTIELLILEMDEHSIMDGVITNLLDMI